MAYYNFFRVMAPIMALVTICAGVAGIFAWISSSLTMSNSEPLWQLGLLIAILVIAYQIFKRNPDVRFIFSRLG